MGMRFGGLVQPPCDGVLPLLPLRWGLCPASVRRAILRLDERPTPSGDGSRFRALLAPEQADGAVPAPSQPDTIPSFFHLASLSSMYRFGCFANCLDIYPQVWISIHKRTSAPAHQWVCGGRSPVCMCYATNDGGGKETTQRKRKRKNGAIRICDGIAQSPLTHLTQGGLLGGVMG